MAFFPFEMERMMSRFEQAVDYNLSESGVHPILLREMCEHDPDLMDRLLATDLNYPHVNGIPELRENIAALYDGATAAGRRTERMRRTMRPGPTRDARSVADSRRIAGFEESW